MEAGRVPNDGIIQVEIRKAIPTQLLPGQIVMYQVSESVGVLYKGNPDGSVSLDDTSTDIRLPNGTATKLFLKWNNTSGLFEARTKVEFISDIQTEGSATDIFYWWNEDEEAWEAITKLEMLNLLIPEGTPVNGLEASKVLTVAGTPAEGETVTIGGVTYKARLDALGAGVAATGTLTFNEELPHDGDTVIIGNQTYTFRTELTAEPVPNEILIEASVTLTIDNLISAVNDGPGEGTKYSTGTISQGMVTCNLGGDNDSMIVTYDTVGFLGNQYDTLGTLTHATWGDTTLKGGIDAESANDVFVDSSAEHFIDNLVLAITAGAGAGTKYGTGTVVHPTVTAVKASASTMTTTAKTKGTSGNSIAIAETLANGSSVWAGGATFLSGGVNGTVGSKYDMYKDASYIYITIDANTATTANWRRIALGTAY